jgi:hypothetical protein
VDNMNKNIDKYVCIQTYEYMIVRINERLIQGLIKEVLEHFI